MRYALESVKGVAGSGAVVGGFVKEYQIDPRSQQTRSAYGISLAQVTDAVRASNADVGGKIYEVATTEYYIRGRGYD